MNDNLDRTNYSFYDTQTPITHNTRLPIYMCVDIYRPSLVKVEAMSSHCKAFLVHVLHCDYRLCRKKTEHRAPRHVKHWESYRVQIGVAVSTTASVQWEAHSLLLYPPHGHCIGSQGAAPWAWWHPRIWHAVPILPIWLEPDGSRRSISSVCTRTWHMVILFLYNNWEYLIPSSKPGPCCCALMEVRRGNLDAWLNKKPRSWLLERGPLALHRVLPPKSIGNVNAKDLGSCGMMSATFVVV